MKRYDLVVIGTGIAAQTASTRVRAAGRSVAVIDHRPFGGTCALRGCDPKKMLISGAEVVDFARRMHGRGVDGGNHRRPDYRGVPSIAFTLPPIARVGVLESKARDQGLKMRVKSEKASGWYTARRVAESVYGYKTIVEEDSGRILGAHLVGPNVDEVINLFGFAIRHGLTAEDLRTRSSAIRPARRTSATCSERASA